MVVQQFLLSNVAARISIIEFSSQSQISAPLTTNRAQLDTIIAAYTPGGTTHISAGLSDAASVFAGANRPTAGKVILLFTDGAQSYSYGGDSAAIASATEVKQSTGATLISIGFGGVNTETVNAMATAPASQ